MKPTSPHTGKSRLDARSLTGQILILLCFVALITGGLFLPRLIPPTGCLLVAVSLSVAFLLFCLAGHISARQYQAHRQAVPIAERQAAMKKIREDIVRDPEKQLLSLSSVRIFPLFLFALYCLMVAALIVFFTAVLASYTPLAALSVLLAGFLLLPLMDVVGSILRKPDFQDEIVISPDEYPCLSSLTRRAADTLGLKQSVKAEIRTGCDIDVLESSHHTIVVVYGDRFLNVATEEETFQLLLFRMSLFTDRLPFRMAKKHSDTLLLCGNGLSRGRLFRPYMALALAMYNFESFPYMAALPFVADRIAVRTVTEKGDPAVAAAALGKVSLYRFFIEEENEASSPLYHSEEPPQDIESFLCGCYARTLSQRFDVWNDMLSRELVPFTDIFPLYRETCALLHTFPSRLCLPDPDSPYKRETTAAIRKADELFVRLCAGRYTEDRENTYLKPLAIVQEYEASDRRQSAADLTPVIDAYEAICQRETAEALCDDILAHEENPFAQAHACYFKGLCLLHRWDESGIDYIYRAMETNQNYMDQGLEAIGTFCCLMGLEDEYEFFRRRFAVMIEAHSSHQQEASSLSRFDRVEKETALPEEDIQEIIAFILDAGGDCLDRIYLIRKIISEDFATSAFVLKFVAEATPDQVDKTMNAVFRHLDTYPSGWQFSLFLLDKDTEQAVNKVDGSLVWSRTDTHSPS